MAATFVFDAAILSSLDGVNNYYLQAVAATPSAAAATRGDLASLLLSTPQLLTGVNYTAGVLTFADQVFNTRTYTSTHVGFILARRLGASFDLSDPLIAYTPHTNNLGQETTKPIGTYAISLDFSNAGLFTVANAWQYDIGSWINVEAVPKGAIYAIGSTNNTVAFANPHGGKLNVYSGGLAISPAYLLTSRGFIGYSAIGYSAGANAQRFGIDLKNLRIKLGTVGVHDTASNSAGRTIEVYGSNSSDLKTNYSFNWQNFALYDSIGTGISVTGSGGNWYLLASNSSSKYRFIAIQTVSTNAESAIDQLEFYNCSIYSLTQNIA